ncbi:MAG: F0F1 ATP synthase subunit alpha [Candidatus Omnitrophica bacterium]|nr:F0F1 ATP synthase subunit alpha [Candidatus Omnitrophota bacterium]
MGNTQEQSNIPSVAEYDIREVGRVQAIREFLVTVTGLPSCINGQIVEFQGGHLGLVMGFKGDLVQVLVLGLRVDLRIGDEVYNRGQLLNLPVGEGFLGRVVNSLCEPVDGLGPIESDQRAFVFSDAPGVMDRIPVNQTMPTGTFALDVVIPIAKGQRQLLIGDRLTGKTTVALDAIMNQKGNGTVCIYCSIGKPYSSLTTVIDLLREKDALPYTIVVDSTSSTSVGQQYLGPYTACMLGEYFMYRGKDVFVVFDDLTKHAWTYRQISLLLERAPGREAYPGDIFYIHSQLMERAAYLKPEKKGGSMTFFPIIETLQGDLTSYIPNNIISMTDGQIYFDSALFYKGVKPAIDFGLSVSRIGNKAQWQAVRKFSKDFRLEYLQYQALLQMTRLRATGLSEEAQTRLKKGEIITQLISQNKHKPVPLEGQVIYLFALSKGMLDALSTSSIKRFKEGVLQFVQDRSPGLIEAIKSAHDVSGENEEELGNVLLDFFDQIVE